MDDYYRIQYLKLRTENLKLQTEVIGLKEENRKLKRENVAEKLNPKNIFGSRTEKFQINHLKEQNKQKDEIIKNLNEQLGNLETKTNEYKEKFSKTLDMLQQCTNREFLSKDKLTSLKNKVEDLLEDKENQDIQIKKLKKYAKEKLAQILKMEKELKKEEKSQKKEAQKSQKDYERKRKAEEQKAKKEEAERKRKFEEEQKKKEAERIKQEREAARKAVEEERRRKQQAAKELKRKQEEAIKDFQRKKEEEKKNQNLKNDIKEKIEKEIISKWGRIDLTTLNVHYNLGILIIGINLSQIKKLIKKYHPDRAVNKSLEEEIKYEIIFNELNKYKKKLGGGKK